MVLRLNLPSIMNKEKRLFLGLMIIMMSMVIPLLLKNQYDTFEYLRGLNFLILASLYLNVKYLSVFMKMVFIILLCLHLQNIILLADQISIVDKIYPPLLIICLVVLYKKETKSIDPMVAYTNS
jgi:hypothetical protein